MKHLITYRAFQRHSKGGKYGYSITAQYKEEKMKMKMLILGVAVTALVIGICHSGAESAWPTKETWGDPISIYGADIEPMGCNYQMNPPKVARAAFVLCKWKDNKDKRTCYESTHGLVCFKD
jgi:hypothetical protein